MFRTGAKGLNQNKLIFFTAACLFTYVQGLSVLRFATEPSDASVSAGSTLPLHCAPAAGAPGALTTWRWAPALPLDEAPPLDTTGDPYRKILDNGTLELTELGTGAQPGDYQCLISAEGVGTIVSRVATVTLPSLPTFDAEPQDLTVYPGESAFFACSVRGRIPSYTKPSALGRQHHAQPPGPLDIKIQWLKNEAPIRLDETRMTVLPTGALEIDPVGAQDRGAYRCNVSRLAAPGYRLSNKAQLTINMDMTLAETVTAPKFIAEPRSLTVTEGSPVTMDCAASGNPRPDITWLNNGVAIDLNHLDSRFTLLGSGVLYISSVKESDAGTYQCRADNREDSLDATAILDVQVPPRFIKRPLDVTATERQDLELECQVYGRPEPTVRWLKNGEVITPNNHDMALVGGYNLRIQGLMPVDVGIFQCVASNPAGNIQASAQLTVLSAGSSADYDDAATSVAGRKIPSEPLEFTAPIVKARFVALSWREPMTTNGDILAYSVIYKVKGSVRERITNTTRGDVYKMSIPSLQPNTAYHFRALAYNRNGAGLSTQVLEISTQSEELSLGAPRDLRVMPAGPTALQVSWAAPQPVPGAKVTLDKYELLWAESDSPEERSVITSELTYRLTDLHPFTEYAVRVVAHSAGSSPGEGGSPGGSGSPSEQVVVRTPGDAPSSAPLNLTLQPQTSSTVLVIWEAPPPESRNGDITGYKVRYRPHAGRSKTQLLTTPADIRSVTLNNLDRMATYQVRVCAFNVNGTGPFTEWQSVDTLQNDLDESQVPAEPSPLKTQAGSDSIYVSWAPPLRNQNTRVRGYILTWGKGVPDMFFHSVGELIRHHTITDLEPNSEYVITLRASNNVGEGPPVYATVRTRDPGDSDGDLDPGEEEGDEEEGAEGVGTRAHGPQLIPPVGVKADVLSGNTAVVYWTDTTLTKSQQVTDQRFYVVRYSSIGAQRHKYFNTTHLNCMIDDLKPFTQYEFTVKMVKGNRESPWSMVVVNSTLEAAPGSAPREVRVVPGPSPFSITLHWLPPNKANGAITGYVILYTTDRTKRDRDWVVQGLVGGGTSATVRPLQPNTSYHFKVQARNAQGYGPFSHDVTFTTIPGNGFEEADTILSGKEARHGYSMIMYISVGLVVLLLLVTGVVATVICCRRGSAEPAPSPDSRAKTTYQKSSASNIKPPDLWIHHDQMELKQMDKSHHSTSGSGDGVSGVSSMTLPRPSRDSCEYDTALPAGHSNPPCSSLDKRHYVPTYVGSSSPVCGELSLGGNSSMGGASSRNSAFLSTGGQSGSSRPMIVAKPKPMLNVEHYSRDPTMSSINTCTISSSNPDAIPPGMRPMYPRTQYPVPSQPSRHHLNIDQNTPLLSAAGSSISGTLPSQSSISSLGQASALHHHHPAMGISPMSCSQMSCVAGAPPCPSPSPASEGFPDSAREREQGHYVAYEALHPPRDSLEAAGASGSLTRRGAPVHPLRSFSVPAPPPSDAPHTPHHHVSVTIRPTNTSPYKKPLVPAVPVNQSPSSHLGQGSMGLNRLQQGMLVPHSNDELEPLAPSCSTERLHQEMANLEGLMKDLNAITANQFEC